MEITNLLLIVVSALNIFLALFVLKDSRKATNFFFGLFILGTAFWSLSIALFRNAQDYQNSIFYIHLIYISGTLVPVSFLFFARSFIGKKFTFNLLSIVFFLVPSILTGLLFTPFFIEGIILNTADKTVVLGKAYFLWVGYFCVYMSIASFWLFREFLKTKGLIRQQLGYIMVAIFFLLIGVLPFNIFFPVFGDYKHIFIGPIFLTVMTGVITYSIIVHRLMDIRFVAARSLAYTLLLLILGTFYATGLFLASTFFIKEETNFTSLTVSTVLALFMAFTFQPLKTILEGLTDKFFFKGNYDTQDLLSKLGSIMNSYIDLELLNKKILETIIKEVRITRGAFIIFGDNTFAIYNIIEIGFNNRFVMSYQESFLFFRLSETTIFDDLEEGEIKNLMRAREVDLVKVLKVNDKIIGLLVLGGKSSGGVYSSQDLKFLDIISPEVAVAIQNSLSYDKIKKFNFILSQEIQKATADLRQANERLKSLDELKDDFVSIASHELRTPMTAIRSYAWMALNRSDMQLNEKMEKYLIRVLMSTERLINLVNDMLNISRIESGKIEINPELVDPILLCKDIIDEVYYSKSVDKKINFILLEKPVPKIFADPDKLRQVLLNLVGNALKFTPNNGSITLDFFTDGKIVEISVKDTGTGISKEDISRLFQKFSRLDNSYVAAATSGGTGLGLYISKKIIELMHGTIRAYSQGAGKGSTFTFSLPVASPEILQHAKEYTIKPMGDIKGLEPAAL